MSFYLSQYIILRYFKVINYIIKMGQNQVVQIHGNLLNALRENDAGKIEQITKFINAQIGEGRDQFIQNVLNICKEHNHQKQKNQQIDQIIESDQAPEQPKNRNIQIFEKEILWITKVEDKICNAIIQLMSTKKLYHIRQNFRKLALFILGLQNLQFYVFHDSGRIQYHDFKDNFITQILQSNQKRKLLQMALANTSATIQNINIEEECAFTKLFGISNSCGQKYVGQINKANQKFSVLVLFTQGKQSTHYPINGKAFDKIVKISMIQIQEQTQYDIIQFYSKQLLDILGFIVNDSQDKIKRQLKSEIASQKSLAEIMKTVSKTQNNENIIVQSLKYQEFRFDLLERVRMYSKYVCEKDIVFMDFNETGVLNFLANNREASEVGTILASLVLTDDLCIENIFPDCQKLQLHIKRAIEGLSKNKKMYQIQNGTKARITLNDEDQISRIQILIQEPVEVSQGSCSSSTLGGVSSKKKKSSNNSDSLSIGKNKSQKHILHKIQKQNPGIMDEGWLNLFIKDHLVKRKNNIMTKKKRTLFARGQQSSKSICSHKKLRFNEIQAIMDVDIYSPDANILLLDDQLLEPFVKKVFCDMRFFKNLQFKKEYFDNFLSDLHRGYQVHENPFHNFTHGINVMHTCFLICSIRKNDDIISPLKLFSTVLSGLCHDVGHTGRTNSFQIASKSKKALTYNDLSPLQNFHASFTFQILRRPQNNFLEKISSQDYSQIRRDIVSNILYTDIKEHFPLIKKFKAIQFRPQEGRIIACEDLRTLTGMIIHTSDFGGSAKQFQICKQWSRRVNIQFSAQYREQAQLGISQTPFFKDLQIESIMAKNQMGFLKVIVFPLYEALNQFYQDQGVLLKLKTYTQQNIKWWEVVQVNSSTNKDQSKDGV